MTARAYIAAVAVGLAFATLPPTTAHAGGPHVTAELVVLLGTQVDGGGSIDPRIGDLPQLKKRPLSSYNTYQLLDRTTLDLEEAGQARNYPAPNGSALAVKLKSTSGDDAGTVRYTIRQEISGGGLRHPVHVEVTSGANDLVFVGGLPHQGGAIFFGIKIIP
jgi:hypothetical protein